jgi:hypothetical protein
MRWGSEWAEKSTRVRAGMFERFCSMSLAIKRMNAGSIAQESIPITVMPCGNAASVARPTYWPMEYDE